MTHLQQELKDLDSLGYEATFRRLKQQQEEMQEKLHVVNLVGFKAALEELFIDNTQAKSIGAFYLNVNYYYHYTKEKEDYNFSYMKKNGIEVYSYYTKSKGKIFDDLHKRTADILNSYTLEHKFFSENFDANKNNPLTQKGLDDFIDSLLSTKIKAAIKYAQLDNQLCDKKEHKSKLKI